MSWLYLAVLAVMVVALTMTAVGIWRTSKAMDEEIVRINEIIDRLMVDAGGARKKEGEADA